MTKFTLAQILVAVGSVALTFAWISSNYWFGPTKLRQVSTAERIVTFQNEMLEAGASVAMMWEGKNLNVRYKCPHCKNETTIPKPENTQFFAKEISRFNNDGSFERWKYHEHFDLYCSGCRRPARLIARMGLLIATRIDYDPKEKQKVYFHTVVESEF